MSTSFEYCANKLQATEATSENCWIFSMGLNTNYYPKKQKHTHVFFNRGLSKSAEVHNVNMHVVILFSEQQHDKILAKRDEAVQ